MTKRKLKVLEWDEVRRGAFGRGSKVQGKWEIQMGKDKITELKKTGTKEN